MKYSASEMNRDIQKASKVHLYQLTLYGLTPPKHEDVHTDSIGSSNSIHMDV